MKEMKISMTCLVVACRNGGSLVKFANTSHQQINEQNGKIVLRAKFTMKFVSEEWI